jgi:6-phosphogluconolactonase (cycloisomerase 2 family)
MKGLQALLWAQQMLGLLGTTEAGKHNLFVSSFRTRNIFSISYDDETGYMREERSVLGYQGHTWLAFNWNKTVLYASQQDGWSSYTVLPPSLLAQSASVPINRGCQGQSNDPSETSLYVSKLPPYYVYGAGRSACSQVVSVRPDGSLEAVVQTVNYRQTGSYYYSSANTSRVEGFAMSPDSRWLYSADSRGSGIWITPVDIRGRLGTPAFSPIQMEDIRPRRLALHPSGRYLYVLNRRPNRVFTFEVIRSSNPAQPPSLIQLDVSIALVPTG